jgi:acyl-CoA synthetase (AMP-forming)/AMP-acid ligase II
VVATASPGTALEAEKLLAVCREKLPLYMVPAKIDIRDGPLPRNPNGKIDRKLLCDQFSTLFDP